MVAMGRRENLSVRWMMGGLLAVFPLIAMGEAVPATAPSTQNTATTQTSGLPDSAAQTRAERLIREVFKEDYAQRGPEQRQALARKLLQQGIDTRDDATARFVLFSQGRDLAAGAGDARTALRAIDRLGDSYPVAVLEMKLAVLTTAGHSATSVPAMESLVLGALGTLDQAIAADDYDAATRLASLAESTAQRSKQVQLIVDTQARSQEVRLLAEDVAHIASARERLRQQPNDPRRAVAGGSVSLLHQERLGSGSAVARRLF